MKSFLKKDKLLVVLALLALLVSLVPIARRVQTEESNKYYDCVLDYASLRAMARQSEMSEDEWLGVEKAALGEASALDLHQSAAIPVHAMTVKKAMENYGWEDSYPAEVASWLRESTDVSDCLIWTETAAGYE